MKNLQNLANDLNLDQRRDVFTRVALALLNARPISALSHDGTLDKSFLDQIQKLTEHIVREADVFANSAAHNRAAIENVVHDVLDTHSALLQELKD